MESVWGLVDQRHQVGLPANFVQLPTVGKRFGDGDQVQWLACFGQVMKGFPNPLVADDEEIIR